MLFWSQNIDWSTPSNGIYRCQPDLGPRNPNDTPEAPASASMPLYAGLERIVYPQTGWHSPYTAPEGLCVTPEDLQLANTALGETT